MVSKELLVELKEILEQDFGLSLTMGEVSEVASEFVSYFDLLTQVNYADIDKTRQKATILNISDPKCHRQKPSNTVKSEQL